MIKIKYLPKTPKVKKYRATCKCGCVFTYDDTDKIKKCFGHGDFWDIVFCPNCSNVIGTLWDDSKIEEI